MNLSIIQLADLSKLDSYLKMTKKNSIVLIGEYVLNPFFAQIKEESKNIINELSQKNLDYLKKISKTRKLTIVAPVLYGQKDKIYKQIAIINSEEINFYMQQKLISFKHWNEEKYFDNPKQNTLKLPYIFQKDGFKIAVLFGFEVHYDEIWYKIKKADVDIVLLPTASTFESNERWRELCKTRAFCNGCVIIRANRVGIHHQDGYDWRFYGDSFVVYPDGSIDENKDCLGQNEESLEIYLEKDEIYKIVKEWNFRSV